MHKLGRWRYLTALPVLALIAAGGLFLAGDAEARNVTPANDRAVAETQQPVQAVTVRDFSYSPQQLSTIVGQPLTINVTNAGPAPHTFTISGVADSGSIAAGQSRSVQLTPSQTGTLTFFCTIHGQGAMSGTLSVMTPATNPVQPGTQATPQQQQPQQVVPTQPPPVQQQPAPPPPPRPVIMQPPSTGDAGLAAQRYVN